MSSILESPNSNPETTASASNQTEAAPLASRSLMDNSLQHNLSKDINQPTIALLPCCDLFEDFFDTIGVSLESYCKELTGGWQFNYIESLKQVGVRTIIVFFSARVQQPTRFTHIPTDTVICVLPPSRPYRLFRLMLRQMKAWWKRSKTSADGKKSADSTKSDTKSGTKNNSVSESTQPSRQSKFSILKSSLKSGVGSFGSYISTPIGLLAQELRDQGCSAILCQDYEYARFDVLVLLGKLMKIPVFATFQGGDRLPSPFEYPFRWLSLRASQGLIVAPQLERDRLQAEYGLPSSQITRVFNPLDTANWDAIDRSVARAKLGIPAAARVVVFHGRMQIWQKGLDVLLAAWDTVCRERPHQDLRLLLVGTGSDADELRRRITAMGLRGILWIDEYIRDRTAVQTYLSAADLYTLPSRKEGFPVAPLEAMACRLPIVAADVAGVSDILEQGEASGGIIVPCEDAEALALNIGRLIDNAELTQELGQRARVRVEQTFSFEAIGQQLKELLIS